MYVPPPPPPLNTEAAQLSLKQHAPYGPLDRNMLGFVWTQVLLLEGLRVQRYLMAEQLHVCLFKEHGGTSSVFCPPPPFSWAAFVTGNLSSFLYSFLSLQLSSLPVSGRRRRRGGGVMPCSKQLYWHLNWMWITVIIQPSCFLAGIQRLGEHQCAAASQAGGHKATHARIHTALARIGIHPLRHDTHAPRRAHRSAHGWRREWSSLLWVPGPVETAM